MGRVGAVVPDWVSGVDLDGEDTGAHDAAEDIRAVSGLAWGVERALCDGVSA